MHPDDEAEPEEVEPCCMCGRTSICDYDDREDCPSCGSPVCELKIQFGLDYIEERGS